MFKRWGVTKFEEEMEDPEDPIVSQVVSTIPRGRGRGIRRNGPNGLPIPISRGPMFNQRAFAALYRQGEDPNHNFAMEEIPQPEVHPFDEAPPRVFPASMNPYV